VDCALALQAHNGVARPRTESSSASEGYLHTTNISGDFVNTLCVVQLSSVSALTLLVGRQEGHTVCKKTERWGAGVVICLERGADLHVAQLMPLPLTVSCFSKIQIGLIFLVPAHPGSPEQRAVKR